MIKKFGAKKPVFVLTTDNTTYVFSVTDSGHLEHLYYGPKTDIKSAGDCDVFREKREFELGNTIRYSKEYPNVILEDMCLEMSSLGHGDIREPFLEITRKDGSQSSDFLFSSYEINYTKDDFSMLPGSYSEDGKVEHLRISLTDRDVILELHYYIYPCYDVITRSSKLINRSDDDITVKRLLSLQIDIPFSGAGITSFHGAWAREMYKNTTSLTAGKFVIESRCGISSSRANPFFMVHSPSANEHSGYTYGFNLIYSGNHYSSVEVSPFGKTRIVSGIQPLGFSCILKKDSVFEAPEAVMTFSGAGFSKLSHNFHGFINDHIIRGKWKNKTRPVLLNSWEACYFNITENIIVALARKAKQLGIELFVVDDGWFGERNDDSHSLGDWDENRKKLPKGLKGLSDKLKSFDMKLGIWVEPEMVNTESRLYRLHPEWTMDIPGVLHSEGRNQRILDFTNPQVTKYITDKLTSLFSKADISYVKWDMNRIFSDIFSKYLPPEKQGETAHRYILGLYSVLKTLTERFHDILFEGCASGGNRFDLGMLCYFPQIWASDNTDAVSRTYIQEGYSYGYPLSCISNHVSSSPNHQTLRVTPLSTRFNISSFGILGYECNVHYLNAIHRKTVKDQIRIYKSLREVFQFGDFYRGRSGNVHEWICVSKDKKYAVAMLMQELVRPNFQSERLFPVGLDPNMTYRFHNLSGTIDIRIFGSLINAVAPIRIKQDSLAHRTLSKAIKLKSEKEEIKAKGSVLMSTGITLSPQFSGTGFNENTRVFPDFSSRLYFFEAEEN